MLRQLAHLPGLLLFAIMSYAGEQVVYSFNGDLDRLHKLYFPSTVETSGFERALRLPKPPQGGSLDDLLQFNRSVRGLAEDGSSEISLNRDRILDSYFLGMPRGSELVRRLAAPDAVGLAKEGLNDLLCDGVDSGIVEGVRIRVFRHSRRLPDLSTSDHLGTLFFNYGMSRSLLFEDPKSLGLFRIRDGEKSFIMIIDGAPHPSVSNVLTAVWVNCVMCHSQAQYG